MKYFFYLHFYLLSTWDTLEYRNISTTLSIWQDSVKFYVFDYGYTVWSIEEIIKEVSNVNPNDPPSRNKPLNAIYLISFREIKAILYIKSPETQVKILTNAKPIIIYLKE